MRTGPQIECERCGMPILLGFTVLAGSTRTLSCPACDHVHLWVVDEVRGPSGTADGQTWLRSSVE